MNNLYAMRPKEVWNYIKTQDILFWLINIILFFEYIRPQTLYPSIDILPFSQIIILLTLSLLFLREDYPFVKSPINVHMILFLLVIVLSSGTALNSDIAFEKIPDFIAWLIIYFLIINIVNTEERFLVFILMFLLYSFKMAQFAFRGWVGMGFSYSNWGTGGGPGWFHNSGEFGIQMCIFLPLAYFFIIALRKYWPKWKVFFFLLFPLFAISGTISSSSRGALLGAAAVMLWILLKSRYKVKGLIMFGVIVMLVIQFIPPEQMARFEIAGHEDDRTSQTRIERWEKGLDMAARYPLLGVGFANWSVADRTLFGEDGGLSHNIFIQCVSELGYLGLSVFVMMIFYTLILNYKTRKLVSSGTRENLFLFNMAHGLDGALIGFLVSGFFVTVLYYPYFWINISLTVALNNVARVTVVQGYG